jgi:5-methylcytosine-specific restriction endonuclease McrA
VIYIFTRESKSGKSKRDENIQKGVESNWKVLRRKELETFFNDKLDYKEKERLYDIFERRCFKCGSRERLTIDHHLPLSKGYPLKDKEAGLNGVILCEKCNSHKGDNLPSEYYERKELQKLEEMGIRSHLYYSPDRLSSIEERLLSWKVKFLEESINNGERVKFIYLDQEDILFVNEDIEVLPLRVYSRKKFLYRGYIWEWFLKGEGSYREYFNIRWIYRLEKSCKNKKR